MLKINYIHFLWELILLLNENSHVCMMQIRYPSLVLCSSGSETHEAAGEYSRRQSAWQVGGVLGDRRRCTSSSKNDL